MAFNFDNFGHYGIYNDIDCLYDGNAKELIEAFNSGEPFDTGWHGFKKELESLRIERREDGRIEVSVSEYMDSAYEEWDLILDCLTDEESERLTDEMVDEIRGLLSDEFVEEIEYSSLLNSSATIDEVFEKASELINDCHERLHDSYLECMSVSLYVLYGHPTDTKFIEERIEKAR